MKAGIGLSGSDADGSGSGGNNKNLIEPEYIYISIMNSGSLAGPSPDKIHTHIKTRPALEFPGAFLHGKYGYGLDALLVLYNQDRIRAQFEQSLIRKNLMEWKYEGKCNSVVDNITIQYNILTQITTKYTY